MGVQPRGLVVKLTAIGALLSFITLLYFYTGASQRVRLPSLGSLFPSDGRARASCAPEAWADGHWARRRSPIGNETLTAPRDVFAYNGFDGCASDREFFWHLGADKEEQWDRFPDVLDYEWVPGEQCAGVRPLTGAALVRDLVEQGGWLVLGDSITENHFFSLSCTLFPHVRATPNYTENPYFDRAWPQNLYLNPSSPLLSSLRLPPGFSIEETPLITFRRVDLLLEQTEIESVHRTLHPELYADGSDFALFSDEKFWSLSPSEYMPMFTAPLPRAHYATLVVSTAGHWTTTLFGGLRDASRENDGYGIEHVLELFAAAMRRWAEDVQRAMDEDRRVQTRKALAGLRPVARQVVVRAYLPGHEDCHSFRAPWAERQPFKWNWYNWAWIGDMNARFQILASAASYPDIHFLPIDRPALLRPDAHATGDCLHLLTGAGVLEGWTHYIWHFVTRE
ncbi:hypothetical protein HETIRDRAFT_385902, partial [Heterobasidion irregulare TC 32-1]